MRIVCAESVLFGAEAFGTLGNTVVIPDRFVSPQEIRGADALIVRSKTIVDARLLARSRVKFVATATAGTDHMDIGYLNRSDIAWCSAPGCNADSVSEYVIAALCCLAARHHRNLDGLTLGVVGVGQVGSRVARRGREMGMTVLRNDPPLQILTGDPRFVLLEEVLHKADAVTLHVPLTRAGQFPTFRMADCHFFEHMKPGCIFINTSRGEVVDSDGLLFALDRHAVGHAVLDVWEHEPFLPLELLRRVAIGTPHVAGYSFEGRLNGTVAAYHEACHFFEVEPSWQPDERTFPQPPAIVVDSRGKSDEEVLWQVVQAAYDIEADDRALREGAVENEGARGMHFDTLRRTYRERREFAAASVKLAHASGKLRHRVTRLGFRLV